MDDDGVRVRRRAPISSAARAPTSGWTIALRAASRAGSAKTSAASAGPVERAVGGEHVRAERRDDRGEARRTRLDHLAGQHVGVDHRRRRSSASRRATVDLPDADPAGQTDAAASGAAYPAGQAQSARRTTKAAGHRAVGRARLDRRRAAVTQLVAR